MSGHHGHDHDDVLVEVKIELEEEHIEALNELAKKYSNELKQDWDLGAVVRVAVGNFLNTIGKLT
ncbi:MAG: hypothetical protein KAR06_01475 [Deltaproteobacteria bacterium]|nr:hypothetical protein [Deltaproteobacteria bacterium]